MTRLVHAAAALGLASLSIAAAYGCVVEGFELVSVPAAGGAGGLGGSGAQGGSPGGMGGMACGSKQWPSPPARPDPPGQDVEIVVALRSLDFGEGDLLSGPKVGYDLDGRCSCADDGPSCNTPEPEKQSCDGPMGIDNGIAELFAAASVFDSDFTSAYHSERADQGAWTILVRVRSYNGEANDDQIEVALFPSGGLDADPCHPGGPPAWDGSDAWPVMTSALEGPGGGGGGGAGACGDPEPPGYSLEAPKYVDSAGYVTEGVMVASLPNVVLALANDGTGIKLSGGFLTGRLEEISGDWYLKEGTLAGRWPLGEVFQTVSKLGSDGMPLCTDDSAYNLIHDAVCNKRDITAQLSGPTAPCDAVSFGMDFEAEPAKLGLIYFAEDEVTGSCPPETDPALDTCPQ